MALYSAGQDCRRKGRRPCIIAGYPNRLRKNGKVPLVVRGARIADMQYAPTELLSSCEVSDGDSGGGILTPRAASWASLAARPRLQGVLTFGPDGFALLWDRLLNGPALSDPVPFDASPAAAVVRKAIEGVPPIVCEVLGDGKRRALGTVVSPDGYVLTKASELYGDISCRLADGRVLPAVVRNVARQHDLALLKIDVAGLPNIIWSHSQESPVGTLVASPRIGELPAVGVVSYPTHKVGPAVGYLGIGKVKDGEGGVQVKELRGCWRPEFVKQVRNIPRAALPDYESPIRVGDIIVSIEGRAVPNAKTLRSFENSRRRTGPGGAVCHCRRPHSGDRAARGEAVDASFPATLDALGRPRQNQSPQLFLPRRIRYRRQPRPRPLRRPTGGLPG